MTIEEFRGTLTDSQHPAGLSAPLQAMWEDGRGQWEAAHVIAQAIEGETGAWLHAYLHRKEGDLNNAGYWYRQAGRTTPTHSLEEEWTHIVTTLLQPEVGDNTRPA